MGYDKILADTLSIVTSNLAEQNVDSAVSVTETSSFTSDLNLDSLQIMELIAEFEDHFDIVIPIDDLPQIDTVGDVAKLLVPLVDAKSGG